MRLGHEQTEWRFFNVGSRATWKDTPLDDKIQPLYMELFLSRSVFSYLLVLSFLAFVSVGGTYILERFFNIFLVGFFFLVASVFFLCTACGLGTIVP